MNIITLKYIYKKKNFDKYPTACIIVNLNLWLDNNLSNPKYKKIFHNISVPQKKSTSTKFPLKKSTSTKRHNMN